MPANFRRRTSGSELQAANFRQRTSGADGADAGPVPRAFVAVTVQVYDLAAVSPDTVRGPAAPLCDRATPTSVDVQVAE
jgi:hypothetical protein